MCTFLAETKLGDTFLFHSQVSPFHDLFSTTFFVTLLVILLFKMAPSTVLKCCLVFLRARRLGCALWRKYMIDKCHLSMSYRAVGCVFNVSKSTIYSELYLNRKACQTRLCIDQLMIRRPEVLRSLTLHLP